RQRRGTLELFSGFAGRQGVVFGVRHCRAASPRRFRDHFFLATCERSRSSAARSSPVGSLGANSAGSNTWRISTSPSSLCGLGQRFSHWTASSIDLHCQSQKPAISSLVSAKGPSITVRLLPANRTRFPFELGCSP